MNLAPGSKVGNYEILGILGTGGMGQVYRARDIQLGRLAAIKFVTDSAGENEDRLRRFFTEAKAASALNHPNILTVYGIGEHEKNPFIAMEYVDGQTLRSLITQANLPLNKALDITLQTLAGLSKAHSIGIVHRDLKPENIMITSDGFVKILDFGLAKLLKDETPEKTAGVLSTLDAVTKTGMIVGTAAYMSPEQARGLHSDLRSDLFSLGIVLFEMLTGTNPFRRATTVDTISAILRDVPPPLVSSVRTALPGLSALLEKALEKESEKRFASAREMEQAIHNLRIQLNSKELAETVEFSTVTPATLHSANAVTVPQPLRFKSVAGILAIIITSLLVFFILSLFAVKHFRKSAQPAVSGPPVIAVMAFENKTSDPELAQADIGRVLADAFVQVLYDCQGVQVISPWRINGAAAEIGRTFSDTSRDLKLVEKLTENLNANIILSGSLTQVGETFVLNASLTDIVSGKLVGNFSSKCQGKNGILSELTKDISENLKETLTQAGVSLAGGRESKQLATGSLDAYAHYLAGRDLNNEGKWNEGVSELEKALAIDPNMALAWAELGCAYSFAGDETRSKAALNKALALKPRLTRREQAWLEALSAWILGSGSEFRKAMESFMKEFPDDRDAHFYVGLAWQWLDHDCKKALESYEASFRLTPNYYPLTKAIVDCHLELKQPQQAIQSLNRYLKVARSGYGHQQARARLNQINSTQ